MIFIHSLFHVFYVMGNGRFFITEIVLFSPLIQYHDDQQPVFINKRNRQDTQQLSSRFRK